MLDYIKAARAVGYGILAGLTGTATDIVPDIGPITGDAHYSHVLFGIAIALIYYSKDGGLKLLRSSAAKLQSSA